MSVSSEPSRARVLHVRNERISSRALLSAQGHLVIEHGGARYQLRQTSSGKLILTREPGFQH